MMKAAYAVVPNSHASAVVTGLEHGTRGPSEYLRMTYHCILGGSLL
jgi:hypothetical protein